MYLRSLHRDNAVLICSGCYTDLNNERNIILPLRTGIF
nr:MAG TPA: 15 kDa core protein [Caudoviricetes sp.]